MIGKRPATCFYVFLRLWLATPAARCRGPERPDALISFRGVAPGQCIQRQTRRQQPRRFSCRAWAVGAMSARLERRARLSNCAPTSSLGRRPRAPPRRP
eukprot:4857644-Pyramimonas_sp.AAC.1